MAAGHALKPFSQAPFDHTLAKERPCGVRAHFLGQSALPWYEEYPANPSVFVLNGFIFSLVGLFDLTKVRAGVLFRTLLLTVGFYKDAS